MLVVLLACLLATGATAAAPTRGSGMLSAATGYATGGAPGGVAIADLNGDGISDLVVANGDGNTVSVLLGQKGGGFTAQVTYATLGNPDSVAIGDVTGDGIPDVVVAESNSDAGNGQVSVLPGTGTGTLGTRVDYQVGATPDQVVLADLNGDGRLDAVAVGPGGSAYATSGVYVLLNTGGGFGTDTVLTAGSSPEGVAVADFDGDGHPDIVAANEGDSTISIFYGNGDGTFASSASAPAVGAGPVRVATGDLNGDGLPDIVTANSTGNTFSEFLNDNARTFTSEPAIGAGTFPRSLRLADLDGDGHLDIVAVNNDSNIAVALGKGDGSFVNTAFYPTGKTPLDLAVGDLDGDGRNDVASTSFSVDQVDVLAQSPAAVTTSRAIASAQPTKPAAGTTQKPIARAAVPTPTTTRTGARSSSSARPSAAGVKAVTAARATAATVPKTLRSATPRRTTAASEPTSRVTLEPSAGPPPAVSPVSPVTGQHAAAAGRPLLVSQHLGRRKVANGPAATAFALSIPSPTQTTAKQVGEDSLLALLLLALLEIPVTLVNQTSKHNYTVILGGLARFGGRLRAPSIAQRLDRLPLAVAFTAYATVAGLLYGFLEPSFGLDRSSLALVLGLVLALFAQTAAKGLSSAAFYRRIGHTAFPKLFPGFLVLAVLCVGLSRLLGLEPGIILGTLISIGTRSEVEDRDEGRTIAIAAATVAAIAALAWVSRGTIISALGHQGDFGPTVLSVALTTLVVVGVQELAFGLLPFTFLEGEPLFHWSKPVWAALSLVGVFGFVHILLRPRPGEAAYDGRTLTLGILLIGYLVIALTYWGFFRRRVRRQEIALEPGPVAAGPAEAEPVEAASPPPTDETPVGTNPGREPATRRTARQPTRSGSTSRGNAAPSGRSGVDVDDVDAHLVRPAGGREHRVANRVLDRRGNAPRAGSQ